MAVGRAPTTRMTIYEKYFQQNCSYDRIFFCRSFTFIWDMTKAIKEPPEPPASPYTLVKRLKRLKLNGTLGGENENCETTTEISF